MMFDKTGEATITGHEYLWSGSEYSMLDPREVHSVSPRTPRVLTLMVTGATWQEEWQRKIAFNGPLAEKARPSRKLEEIPTERRYTLINSFRKAFEERGTWDKQRLITMQASPEK
jgi:hypothetical protein